MTGFQGKIRLTTLFVLALTALFVIGYRAFGVGETSTTAHQKSHALASNAGGGTAAKHSPNLRPPGALTAKPLYEDVDYGVDTDEFFPAGDVMGGSVSILTGNAVDTAKDLAYPSPHRLGLSFVRTYNSRAETSGIVGYGWSHSYAVTLTIPTGSDIYYKIVDPSGRCRYFTEPSTGIFAGAFNERTKLVRLSDGRYAWYTLDRMVYYLSSTGQLTNIYDGKSNRLRIAYDARNRISTVTDHYTGRVLTFHYDDATGLLRTIEGPLPNTTTSGTVATFSCDANSNLTSVLYADTSGFTYDYTGNNGGDVHNLTRTRNNVDEILAEWTYDADDRCTGHSSLRARGPFTVSYAGSAQVDVTDPYGWVRSYTIATPAGRKRVTGVNNPSTPTDIDKAANAPYAATNALAWTYDSTTGFLTDVTFPRAVVNHFQDFDADGRGLPGTVVLAYGSAQPRTITYTCHPRINTILTRTEASVLGAGNKVTIFDYDDPAASGDNPAVYNENPTNLPCRKIEKGYRKTVAATVAPYEYITVLTYNDRGQVESVDGPRSGTDDTTTFAYDSTTKDLSSITRPLIGSTVFSDFDAAGNPKQVTDVNGQIRTFVYDGRGRTKEVHNAADGSVRQVTYSRAGRPTLMTDEDLVNRSFIYDTYGQIRRTLDNEGNYVKTIFDERGNLTQMQHVKVDGATETVTRQKTWQYGGPDYPGLLYKDIDADGNDIRYRYDASGNPTTIIDRNENRTGYAYDAMNRVTSITRPGNAVTLLSYDTQGNLTSVVDPEGHTTTYTYDDMGNLIGVSSPDTGISAYGFRPEGDLWWKQDANGVQVTYYNDALYRRRTVSYPAAGDLPAYNVTYSYDQRANGKGHVTSIYDPSGSTVLNYDARGRLKEKKSTVSGIQFTLSRQFTDAGRVSRLTYPDGRTVSYDRGACKCKIVGMKTRGAGETTDTILLANLDYQPFGPTSGMDVGNGGAVESIYDLNGRLHIANLGKNDEVTFNYYPNGQLESTTAPNVLFYNSTYGYDALDRLELFQRPTGTLSYGYDKVGNRRSLWRNGALSETCTYTSGTNQLSDINGTARTYDLAGNTTGIGLYQFRYDQDNRLIRATYWQSDRGEYTYNGLGQRVKKVAGWEGNFLYLYDFDGNLVAEATLSGTITKEYIYRGTSRIAMADQTSGAIYFFHNNQFGTPEMMTDSNNNVVWEALYDPFGNAKVSPLSSIVNNFRVPGQYFDAETGLHYIYHRYYEPATGRYLTPDPIGLAGGINPYVYAGNDPVNRVDPLGLYTETLVPYAVAIAPALAMADSPFLPFGDTLAAGLIALAYLHDTWPDSPPSEMSQINDDDKVCDILKGRKGSIKQAALPEGSPSWNDIQDMTFKEINKNANDNVPGYKTIRKLLTDNRFAK